MSSPRTIVQFTHCVRRSKKQRRKVLEGRKSKLVTSIFFDKAVKCFVVLGNKLENNQISSKSFVEK